MTRRKKNFHESEFWVAVRVTKDGKKRRRVELRSCDVVHITDVYRAVAKDGLLDRVERLACAVRDSNESRGVVRPWAPPFVDRLDRDLGDDTLMHIAWAARWSGVSRHTVMRAMDSGELDHELYKKRRVVRLGALKQWAARRG